MRVLVTGFRLAGGVVLICIISPVIVPVVLLYLMDGIVSLLLTGHWWPLRNWRREEMAR